MDFRLIAPIKFKTEINWLTFIENIRPQKTKIEPNLLHWMCFSCQVILAYISMEFFDVGLSLFEEK